MAEPEQAAEVVDPAPPVAETTEAPAAAEAVTEPQAALGTPGGNEAAASPVTAAENTDAATAPVAEPVEGVAAQDPPAPLPSDATPPHVATAEAAATDGALPVAVAADTPAPAPEHNTSDTGSGEAPAETHLEAAARFARANLPCDGDVLAALKFAAKQLATNFGASDSDPAAVLAALKAPSPDGDYRREKAMRRAVNQFFAHEDNPVRVSIAREMCRVMVGLAADPSAALAISEALEQPPF